MRYQKLEIEKKAVLNIKRRKSSPCFVNTTNHLLSCDGRTHVRYLFGVEKTVINKHPFRSKKKKSKTRLEEEEIRVSSRLPVSPIAIKKTKGYQKMYINFQKKIYAKIF